MNENRRPREWTAYVDNFHGGISLSSNSCKNEAVKLREVIDGAGDIEWLDQLNQINILLNKDILRLNTRIAELEKQVEWLNKDKCIPCDEKAEILRLTSILEEAQKMGCLHKGNWSGCPGCYIALEMADIHASDELPAEVDKDFESWRDHDLS